mmetsp:Transcript_46115/g.76340  ORF Transcript_46115/g.76340 Transcript_46115/m.76340 type:complete len:80 (+) Transcript_46115:128-367(+)
MEKEKKSHICSMINNSKEEITARRRHPQIYATYRMIDSRLTQQNNMYPAYKIFIWQQQHTTTAAKIPVVIILKMIPFPI